ncbi:MAG: hypothetical protein ABIG69_07915 [Bacteroidota bacterium]
MGSHNLNMEIKGQDKERFLKTFRKIQDAERREYGTDPYSGTWATIPGVTIVSDPYPNRKWTSKKKDEVLQWIEDNTRKWENAKAVKTSNSFLVAGWAVS